MGFDGQETLTKSDETSDVQDGAGGKMMQLEAIKMEEATEKRMDWITQAAEVKGDEANPFVLLGMGMVSTARLSSSSSITGERGIAIPNYGR